MPERTVLAIGLDSVDPLLLRELIDRGELPVLASLEREGALGRVRSPARIGSGAPWPTFFSGLPPERHEVHATWHWDPQRMAVEPENAWRVPPFWERDGNGLTIGALDIPQARPSGMTRGFAISEWGPHDPVSGQMEVAPAEVQAEITEGHPFQRVQDDSADQPMDTDTLVSACLAGAERRARLALRLIDRMHPDLAIVVFTEIHHSAHELWHTVADDPLYESLGKPSRSLLEVFRALDREVGTLLDGVPADTPVAVFSLHGMRPCRGLVRALHPILTERGYTAEPQGGGPSVRAREGLAWIKRHVPPGLKRLYHRHAPVRLRLRAAQPTIMPPIDWSRTRAFALASADQHGDLRVNLRGREAHGIVAPEDYEPLVQELERELGELRREDGAPLVNEVVRVGNGEPPATLPDLVVHWSDAAFADPMRVRGLNVEHRPSVLRITGQHRAEGFYLLRGIDPPASGEMDPIELKDLLVRSARG